MAKNSTKRALVLSIVSIFMTLAMLMGTTFAWFTDSVTSTGNIIKTGTLDVTFEYADAEAFEDAAIADGEWLDASEGSIFNYSNWEPGYVSVKYVKIENVGSLDFKFTLSIIPSEIENIALADVIEVYMIDGTVAVDRAALNTASSAYVGTLAQLIAEPDGAAHGVLYADDADKAGNVVETYTLALKMSDTAGNEFQNTSVGGSFALQLLATQLTSESDDLGNDYDNDATYPEVEIGNTVKDENTAASVATPDENVQIDIPANAPAGDYSIEVSEKKSETDTEGNTTVSMDITLKKDGVKVTADGTTVYTVSVEIGKNLNVMEITHNGTVITDYEYDKTTGIITFDTADFSPFSFTHYEGGISVTLPENATEEEKAEAFESLSSLIARGGEFTLTEDLLLTSTLVIPQGVEVVLDLNGHKITGANADALILNNGTMVITGGTMENTLVNGGTTVKNSGTLTLEDIKIVGAPIAAGGYPEYAVVNVGDLTIEDGTNISSDRGAVRINAAGTTTINGGIFTANDIKVTLTSHVICLSDKTVGEHILTINGGTFVHNFLATSGGVVVCNQTKNTIYVNGGSFVGGNYYGNDNLSDYGYGGTFNVTGGTFSAKPASKYIADGSICVKTPVDTYVVTNKAPVVVTWSDGKMTEGYETLTEAMNVGRGNDVVKTITVYEDITENITNLSGNIVCGKEGGVTITGTHNDWIYTAYDFNIGEGVTFKTPALFMYAGNSVINGDVTVEAYYQRYSGTHLTINAPGSLTVTTEMFYLRYTDGDPNAGIIVNGDNDDSTVELKLAVAYFYQGMISAKDATLVVGTYWQTNDTDGQGSANLILDNSKLNVTVNEHNIIFSGVSNVTLKNGSVINGAGGITWGANATKDIDETSSIVTAR